jgi:hypothetical protein
MEMKGVAMMKKMNDVRFCFLPVLSLLVTFWTPRPAFAQEQAPDSAVRQRPLPPILLALDASQDGVIDATELANAPLALKKLDQNGDGKLSPDEYLPPRPDRPSPRADGQDPNGQEPVSRDVSQEVGQKNESQARMQDSNQRRPRPSVDLALDENGDETISASELANATALLKKLDANGDGKLGRDECLPKPPIKQDGQAEAVH